MLNFEELKKKQEKVNEIIKSLTNNEELIERIIFVSKSIDSVNNENSKEDERVIDITKGILTFLAIQFEEKKIMLIK